MRYDPQSAFIFSRTDWPSLGAVHSPPDDVPRFGMPLTTWESQALGSARRAAEGSRIGSATETFAQPHPQHEERGIILICTAWCHREGGWTIGLVEPGGQDSGWVLKADIEARLRCACHCDWRADCPGVVSGELTTGHPGPASGPTAGRMSGVQAKTRGWFGSRTQAAAVAAPVAIAASVPDQHAYAYATTSEGINHYQERYVEQDRGAIYAEPEPLYASEAPDDAPAWLSYIDEATAEPDPEPVPLARAERRGFFAALFARRDDPAPAVELPPPLAELGHYEQSLAIASDYDYHVSQISDASDDGHAYALPDHSSASEPLALPPPSNDDRLSSQAEIDDFIAVVRSYADTTPEPEPEPLALPSPEGDYDGR